MFLSELNEQHARILQIVYNAEENRDPLYNIRDSRTYRRVLGSVNRMTAQMCGDDAELKSVIEAAKQYCAYPVDAGYSYDMEARRVERLSRRSMIMMRRGGARRKTSTRSWITSTAAMKQSMTRS